MWGTVILVFLLTMYSAPIFFFVACYAMTLVIILVKYRKGFSRARDKELIQEAGMAAARICSYLGWIYNGYDVKGMENIPDKGAALIVAYHGASHVDAFLLQAKLLLQKKRTFRMIADKFFGLIPGMKTIIVMMRSNHYSHDDVVSMLRSGRLVIVYPGGLRECQFSDRYYRLMWEKRTGFAKAALEANVPIIPVFCKNSREAFLTLGIGKRFFRVLYEKIRFPVVFTFGPFPVKLRSHIGKPIYPGKNMSPEELRDKVKLALEELIACHQRIPGNMVHAFMERWKQKKNESSLDAGE